MSPFRSDALTLALCPASIGVARRQRGQTLHCEALPVAPVADAQDSESAFTALRAWLLAQGLRNIRVEATVSARYARLCLVPWTDRRLSAPQDQAWVRLQFEAVHGDMQGWHMRADPGVYGQPRFACALPASLVTQWHALCREHRFASARLGPYVQHVWNRWRRNARAGQLWGVAESERVVWAQTCPQGWRSMHTTIARAGADELPTLAARERLLLPHDAQCALMLHVPGQAADASPPVQDLAVHWLALAPQDEMACTAMARLVAST